MSGGAINVDAIITKLLGVKGSKTNKPVLLSEGEVKALVLRSREIFMSQSPLLELEAPLKVTLPRLRVVHTPDIHLKTNTQVCGDVHGQYYDLLRLFDHGGFPPDANYIFLGDYVDRGKNSLETACLLLAYKIKFPENFFLLRGNHECASINRIYGFYDDCKRRYNIKLWKAFTDTFNCFPVAAVIDEKIFCMHGGLSPELDNMDQIRNIRRPVDVPDQGLICDLLWGDPEEGIMGYAWCQLPALLLSIPISRSPHPPRHPSTHPPTHTHTQLG